MNLSEESSYELLLCDHPVTVPVHLREQLVRNLGPHCVYYSAKEPWLSYKNIGQNPENSLNLGGNLKQNCEYLGQTPNH